MLYRNVHNMRRSRGVWWAGGPDTLKKSQSYEFLSNTGMPEFNVGPSSAHQRNTIFKMMSHHQPTSKTPLKWHFTCGPMMAHFK